MKIAVSVNVHHEPYRQIEECLTRIAGHLPSANVKIFVNGDHRPEVDGLSRSLGFFVSTVENLGRNETWHLWWLRMLSFFRDSGADVCFKFDPDTMVDAPPVAIPCDQYFGDVRRAFKGVVFVQGGVTGLSQSAVSETLRARILESDTASRWKKGVLMQNAFMDDQLLSVALKHLGILPTIWPECKSEWKTSVLNDPIKYAIVHPRYYS